MFQRLNVCGATRILIPAFFIGMGSTSFTGNESLGWLAAGIVAVMIWGVDRVRGTTATCAVPVAGSGDGRVTGGARLDRTETSLRADTIDQGLIRSHPGSVPRKG